MSIITKWTVFISTKSLIHCKTVLLFDERDWLSSAAGMSWVCCTSCTRCVTSCPCHMTCSRWRGRGSALDLWLRLCRRRSTPWRRRCLQHCALMRERGQERRSHRRSTHSGRSGLKNRGGAPRGSTPCWTRRATADW